jgi:predicted MPP superfamily phosphohydrolase
MVTAMRDVVRRVFFENLPRTAGVALGLAQVLVAHWALAVMGGVALPLAPLALVAVGLAAANASAIPRIVHVGAHRPAWWLAQAYLGLGLASVVFGLTIAASWIGFGFLAMLLAFTGSSPEVATTLFRAGSGAAVGTLGGLLLWGYAAGSRHVETTRLRLALRGLPRELDGLRIAHLSDLHIGNGLEGERLSRLAERVNALHPDAIVLTGDLFDGHPGAVADGARRLAALRAPLGVYGVLGNHDLYTGREFVVAQLAEHAPELALLRGELRRLPTPAALHLAGLDDPGRDWTSHAPSQERLDALARSVPEGECAILLVHRPDAFPRAARAGFALVLSGHYHGGQVALAGGRWSPARLVTRFHRGLYRRDGSLLYVSRGVGAAGPRIRLGSRPEIALLELAASEPGA